MRANVSFLNRVGIRIFGKNFVKAIVLLNLRKLLKKLIWRNIFFGEKYYKTQPHSKISWNQLFDYFFSHSVESCFKTRSQFFGKKLQFFRQTEANLSISSFYYIKLLWENANSNYLGNFGTGFSIDIIRGGF